VVKKDSHRTMSKCRFLSGSIGTSGWSPDYSLWTNQLSRLQAKVSATTTAHTIVNSARGSCQP
jgi:hypothetical protein